MADTVPRINNISKGTLLTCSFGNNEKWSYAVFKFSFYSKNPSGIFANSIIFVSKSGNIEKHYKGYISLSDDVSFRFPLTSEKELFNNYFKVDDSNKNSADVMREFNDGDILYLRTNGNNEYIFPYKETKDNLIFYDMCYICRDKGKSVWEVGGEVRYPKRDCIDNVSDINYIRKASSDEINNFWELISKSYTSDIDFSFIGSIPRGTYLNIYYKKNEYITNSRFILRLKEVSDNRQFIMTDYAVEIKVDDVVIVKKNLNIIYISTLKWLWFSNKSDIDLYNKCFDYSNDEISNEKSLKPFVTKILVSNGYGDIWRPAIFGGIASKGDRYLTVGGMQFKHCLIYREHKELLGKDY